ncbi:four helix bundle protein [Aliifodinibius sp. S!AR15-10]|uniref:four helix bundle protein n=1 Tax=Aliifodinibius sp. S!AR15-10 TaxID=2950437 RepID=UPI0028587750|nr:four helix bundle protein [Aliifodinibius sp. S!AR15-10]MDR8393453.1 four helix bundle protein [Aliifodinibius sp. S!AR15-10]
MDFDSFKRHAERTGQGVFSNLHFQSIRRVLMVKFRFQDLDIWKKAITIADDLFDIADELEQKKLFRFAEQLRGSGLSMSNNIAEGSASNSQKVFRRYLNIARNSTFENANVIIMLERRSLIETEEKEALLNDLDHLCRMITNLKKSL